MFYIYVSACVCVYVALIWSEYLFKLCVYNGIISVAHRKCQLDTQVTH